MLHSGILPHHTKWATLFQNLRYVVIDELHAYRGVFGSHLANVMRRLRRLCRHYGSAPQFIMASATIANPGELGGRIVGGPVSATLSKPAPLRRPPRQPRVPHVAGALEDRGARPQRAPRRPRRTP